MITICEIDPGTFVWTGQVAEIELGDQVPEGWVAAAPPQLAAGELAMWGGEAWSIIAAPDDEPVLVSICRIDPETGRYVGETAMIGQHAPCPPSWVRAEPPEVDEGQAATWAAGEWLVADVVEAPPSIEPARRDLRGQLDALFQRAWTANFAWDFGDIEGLDDLQESVGPAGVRSLQFRDLQDQANWTAAHTNAVAAIMVGQASRVVALKCDDNVWVQTTAQQALVVLTAGTEERIGLFGRQSANLARYGALKKLIASAVDQAGLDTVAEDLAEGWVA